MFSYFKNSDLESLNRVEKKKHHSKQRILKYLFLHGKSDCGSIARHVSLSTPSSQASINELLRAGIIEENGQGTSTGGRRPTTYSLTGDLFYLICIDISRFHVRLSILDSKLHIKTGIKTHEIRFKDSSSYLDEICEYAFHLIDTSDIEKDLLLGVGLSMPGAINSVKGINYSYFYNPKESLVSVLERKFKLPVFLENDTNVLALAESWYGHARDKKNALVLLLSWGIGLGLILNGKIYRGASGFAGEFSHIPVVENGELCWCNKQGCLETIASATALSKLVKEGIENGKASSLFESIDLSKEYIDPKIVIAAANQGDQFAVNILSTVGFQLGKGIASLIQILNPETIILGGMLAGAKQYIITPISHALNSYCNPVLAKNLKIASTDLGEEAPALGLAIMVVETLLSKNE